MANGKRNKKQTPEIRIKRDEGKLEISMRGKGYDEGFDEGDGSNIEDERQKYHFQKA
jgi:hypothetical protein